MCGIAQKYNTEYRHLIDVINTYPNLDYIDFSKISSGNKYVDSINKWIEYYSSTLSNYLVEICRTNNVEICHNPVIIKNAFS